MPSYDRALWALRTWLDSWSGIGHVAVGMHRQGYDLQLTQYERGWRAGAFDGEGAGRRRTSRRVGAREGGTARRFTVLCSRSTWSGRESCRRSPWRSTKLPADLIGHREHGGV